MQSIYIKYIIVLITSVILDSVWLGVIAKNFYARHIGFLMTATPNLKVALLFYIVFAVGVIVFIISPALEGSWSLAKVVGYGALLGLVIYGGYDFTNQAIIKNWPVVITLADLAWGIVMSALTAGISYTLIKLLK
jgi:uncharacterized membrane protein